MRQYVKTDPPIKVYHTHQALNTGFSSVVWQQQMEKTYIQSFNIMRMIHKRLPTYEHDSTENSDIQVRPLLSRNRCIGHLIR